MHVRLGTAADADEFSRLLTAYLSERYPDHPGTPANELRDEVLADGGALRVAVAERGGALIGFMSWNRIYDVHWASSGALVADLYVEPDSRGYGVALALTAAVCAFARDEGGTFLRGGSYDRNSPTGRLYERFAIGFDSAECHCGGRAFRELGDLHGQPVKLLARSLPPKEWNHQP